MPMQKPPMQDSAGNIWAADAQGEYTQLIQPAGAAPTNNVVSPSPARLAERASAESRAAQDQQFQSENNQRAREDQARQDRQFAATHNPDGSPKQAQAPVQAIPSTAATGIQENLKTLRALDDALASVKQRPGSIGPGTGFFGDTVTQYRDPEGTGVRAGVGAVGAFKIHDLSGAAVSASEAPRFTPFVPSVTDRPDVAEAKLMKFREALVGQIREANDFYGPANNYRPYNTPGLADVLAATPDQRADNEVPDPTNGADTKPPAIDNSPEGMPPANGQRFELPTNGVRRVEDPRTKSKIDAYISAGAWTLANKALKEANQKPIAPAERIAIQKWQRSNPGKAYTFSDIGTNKPMTLGQKVLANPYVAPVAAGVARYANSAAAGIPAALAGPSGQGTLDAAAQMNPNAALAGDVLGGVTGAMGAEFAAARALPGLAARGFAPLAGDLAYGGTQGFTSAQEGEGLEGAAKGAGLTALGGGLGRNLMGGLGRVAQGVRNSDVRQLYDAKVPLTVGQAVGKSGLLGRTVQGLENRMSGLPGVGDSVNARYVEGFEGLANRMNNDAVAPINGQASGYGQDMVDSLKAQASDGYTQATSGAQVPLDPMFDAEMAAVRGQGGALPDDLAARFEKAINNRVAPVENAGILTGDSFQQSVRGLKGYRAEMPKAGFEQDYRDALSGGIDALRGQMMRGGGQDVVQGLANADQAYRQVKIIEKATKAARNGSRSGEVGLPTPSQFNDAAYASADKYGTPRFNGSLLDAAQSVMPNKVPDSGTAGRLGVGALLAGGAGLGGGIGLGLGGQEGAQTGGIGGLGAVLLLAAGGSKPMQAAATKMLLGRPDSLVRLGNALNRSRNLGGALGAGAATPYTIGP